MDKKMKRIDARDYILPPWPIPLKEIPIGETLKRIRKSKKLSPVALAKLAGLSHSMIQRTENNQGQPSLKNLRKIATGLGVKLSDLVED